MVVALEWWQAALWGLGFLLLGGGLFRLYLKVAKVVDREEEQREREASPERYDYHQLWEHKHVPKELREPQAPDKAIVYHVPKGLEKLRFGKPVIREYHPDEFEQPMRCPACEHPLVSGEEYWEIPLPRIDGVISVCMPCASRPFSTLFSD